MNERIHHINDIIKQVPGLRYDSSAGIFETDRRALYDFAELIVAECVDIADDYVKDYCVEEHIKYNHPKSKIGLKIKEHFGVSE